MAVFTGAFPVVPGEEDDARKFAQEVNGKIEEFGQSNIRAGITREEWTLQETPMGSLVLVRFECEDVERAFAGFAASQDPFDVWQKKRIQEISGVDLNQPVEGPMPEPVLSWSA